MTVAAAAEPVAQTVLEAVKLTALAAGVRVSEPVRDALGGSSSLTVHEYATTGGITLALPREVLVNAPFDEPFCSDSPLALVAADGGLELRLGELRAPVERVLPLPGYLAARDASGAAVAATTMSHADRIRVSPIAGCAYDCRFCDLATVRYERRPVAQVLRGIDVALADRSLPARHLLVSGGTPARGDDHQRYFEQLCSAVVAHVRERTRDRPQPFEVDVMLSARADGPSFVDRMVDAGVAGFSINLELHSAEHAARQMPLKQRFARPHLEAMATRAVERLGRAGGRVRSLLIAGLEPPEQTLAGIEWLAERGVSPVISPFRPARGTRLAAHAPADPGALREILDEARTIVARHGVELGPRCIPCQHNTLTFPWDCRGAR